ncbi:MAG: helix-turn-helix domain-containing protein [Conexivisphaerales archaeon]
MNTNVAVEIKAKKAGRKPYYTKDNEYISRLISLYNSGASVYQISEQLNISVPTVYRWLKGIGLFKGRERDLEQLKLELELNGFAKIGKFIIGKRLEKTESGLRTVRINFGVGMEGRKFSSTAFFGSRPPVMFFIVKDENQFKFHISKLMEGLFYEHNPKPEQNLKKAFTHFVHSFGFERTLNDSPFENIS